MLRVNSCWNLAEAQVFFFFFGGGGVRHVHGAFNGCLLGLAIKSLLRTHNESLVHFGVSPEQIGLTAERPKGVNVLHGVYL